MILTSAASALSDVASLPTFTVVGAEVLAANNAVPEYSARIAWAAGGEVADVDGRHGAAAGRRATGTVADGRGAALERHGAARGAGGADAPGSTVALSCTVCPNVVRGRRGGQRRGGRDLGDVLGDRVAPDTKCTSPE